MRIPHAIKHIGYFWIPNRPDQKLQGTLAITTDAKVRLEILGAFDLPIHTVRNTVSRIIGELEDNSLVTLERCLCLRSTLFETLFPTHLFKSIYECHTALLGAAFTTDDQTLFSRCEFSVEGLDEWLATSGISMNYDDSDWRKICVAFAPPEFLNMQLTDELKLTIRFDRSCVEVAYPPSVEIRQKAWFVLVSTIPMPLKSFQTYIYRLNNFLFFAMDQVVELDALKGIPQDNSQPNTTTGFLERSIAIYYRSRPNKASVAKINSSVVQLPFMSMKSQLADVLKKWFESYEKMSPAFDLYFASKTGEVRLMQPKFLCLVQGLEILHRQISNELVMPKARFKQLLKLAVDACSTDDEKCWMRERLAHANDPTLRTRMTQLLASFPALFGDETASNKLAGEIVATRNKLTHQGATGQSGEDIGVQLLTLCLKLEVVFLVNFLRLMGLADQTITSLVAENGVVKKKLHPEFNG
jgi:ApeA N-terminal domain 1